jgi:predicted nucleic acid-binding protein
VYTFQSTHGEDRFGLRAGHAIVAATATENNLTLATANEKRFRPIKDLKLKVFKL